MIADIYTKNECERRLARVPGSKERRGREYVGFYVTSVHIRQFDAS